MQKRGLCGRTPTLSARANYFRVKHYLGTDPATGKLWFDYHKQSPEYVQSFQSQGKVIDPIDPKSIDPNKVNLNSISESEWRALVEAGFDYVCDFGGNKIFRKRK